MTSREASSAEIGAAGFESGQNAPLSLLRRVPLLRHDDGAGRARDVRDLVRGCRAHLPSWLQADPRAHGRRRRGVLRDLRASCCSGRSSPASSTASRRSGCAPTSGGACCGSSPATGSRSTACVVLLGQLLGEREERVPLLLPAVPVRESERGVGRRPRSRRRLRDPAGVEPHRRVRLLPDAPAARALARPARARGRRRRCRSGTRCWSASASTSSGSCSGSTSSPPTRRGSGSPRSGRRTGSTSSPSGWRWPPSARGRTPVAGVPRFSAVPRRPPRGVVGHGRASSGSCAARSGRRSSPGTTAPSTGSAGSCSASSPSSCSPPRCSATRPRVGRAGCWRAVHSCTSAPSRSASTSSTWR